MLSKLRSLRTLLLLGAAGTATLAGVTTAFAGGTDSRPAQCTFNADGSGYCSGSLKAFRTSPDAQAYMAFNSVLNAVGANDRSIWVRFGATYKSITVPYTLPAVMLAQFDNVAVAVDAHINISWNGPVATPTLKSLQLLNDSRLIP